jgi:hypothetical protein
MGLFGKKTDEKVEEKEPVQEEEEELGTCADCEKEFPSEELDSNDRCKDCAKKFDETIGKFCYTFKITFREDGDGNVADDLERTHLTKEGAQAYYDATREALFTGKIYVEFKETDSMDDEKENEEVYPIEIQHIAFVENVTIIEEDD